MKKVLTKQRFTKELKFVGRKVFGAVVRDITLGTGSI